MMAGAVPSITDIYIFGQTQTPWCPSCNGVIVRTNCYNVPINMKVQKLCFLERVLTGDFPSNFDQIK